MPNNAKIIVILVLCLVTGSFVVGQIQERKPKKPVTRAAKPTFKKRDWDGVFFEDLFAEGLVGQRPEPGTMVAGANTNTASSTSPSESGTDEAASGGRWVDLIDAAVLENEVKRYQQAMVQKVTTAGRFKTTHQEIRESCAMLAMVFAIIGQYEDSVRWKDSAISARFAFVDAAKRARTTDLAAFNSVKKRSEDLTDLVRGSKFPEEPRATAEIDDWAMVADRDAIMKRLELSVGEFLKEPTSNEEEFKDAQQKVIHEAGMIAAMGRVLQLNEMLDADDEDYNAYSNQMLVAAKDMQEAAKVGNYELVTQALNRINQSCTDCHADWR